MKVFKITFGLEAGGNVSENVDVIYVSGDSIEDATSKADSYRLEPGNIKGLFVCQIEYIGELWEPKR